MFIGDEFYLFVRDGNLIMSVTSLMIFLAWLVETTPVLEQPVNSVLGSCVPLRIVLCFCGMKRLCTWLGSYGGATEKPLHLWYLSGIYAELKRTKPRLSRKTLYVTRGDRSWDGRKGDLRESQSYPQAFAERVSQLTAMRFDEPPSLG